MALHDSISGIDGTIYYMKLAEKQRGFISHMEAGQVDKSLCMCVLIGL